MLSMRWYPRGKWNLDGKGLTQIPVERGRKYKEFAQEKKEEFVMQLVSSVCAAQVSGWIYGLMVRDENFGDVLRETFSWALGAFLATLIVSIITLGLVDSDGKCRFYWKLSTLP